MKRGENGKSPPLPKLASDDGEGPTTTTASGADSGYGRCWWWGCQTVWDCCSRGMGLL
ncbi:hypothetical protein E1A91_D12G121400v1 [Gossypium mustelinum]|uniref:Uncharacterized protein n=1 Tax=Gossypium mustelinum TaxID=34275 RepID=A0A5D2SFV2_GOSMU|nr:hypothetical protein E1A91_D12G121400v1 [Gossypium mustelinum]